MKIDFYFENTNEAEFGRTMQFLESIGAGEVASYGAGGPSAQIAGTNQEHRAYTGNLFVDSNEDVVNLLRLAMFYNDVQDRAIERVASALSNVLAIVPRNGE